MVKKNKFQRVGIRTALSAAMLLTATSASAVTVDGDLSDLIGTIGASSYNYAIGSDPMGSADTPATESNNGFDIKTVYSYYNVGLDTLYLGMSVWGTVGDSRAINDTTSLFERDGDSVTNCTNPGPYANACRDKFDINETYAFSLFKGTSTGDPVLVDYVVQGVNDGSDTGTYESNPFGLTVQHAVSEAFNGIEFSIVGLNAQLSPFGFSNPADLAILFMAGSGDNLNEVSGGAEDYKLLQMQVVPVPAAAWLLGSGLLGLVGLSRRRRNIPLA